VMLNPRPCGQTDYLPAPVSAPGMSARLAGNKRIETDCRVCEKNRPTRGGFR
jgi:hypothetical protein